MGAWIIQAFITWNNYYCSFHLENYPSGADQHSHCEDPEEEAVQDHGHVLPVLENLKREIMRSSELHFYKWVRIHCCTLLCGPSLVYLWQKNCYVGVIVKEPSFILFCIRRSIMITLALLCGDNPSWIRVFVSAPCLTLFVLSALFFWLLYSSFLPYFSALFFCYLICLFRLFLVLGYEQNPIQRLENLRAVGRRLTVTLKRFLMLQKILRQRERELKTRNGTYLLIIYTWRRVAVNPATSIKGETFTLSRLTGAAGRRRIEAW